MPLGELGLVLSHSLLQIWNHSHQLSVALLSLHYLWAHAAGPLPLANLAFSGNLSLDFWGGLLSLRFPTLQAGLLLPAASMVCLSSQQPPGSKQPTVTECLIETATIHFWNLQGGLGMLLSTVHSPFSLTLTGLL